MGFMTSQSGATRPEPRAADIAAPSTTPLTLIYIAGMPRSGSTLLDRVLGATPDVHATGELVHLWQRGLIDNETCGCGVPFSECPFWSAVGETAFGGWATLDPAVVSRLHRSVERDRYLPLLIAPQLRRAYQKRLTEYATIVGRVYAGIAATAGVNVLVDSSKHVSTALLLRHVPGIDLRVVHLVRDPRGVAYSWTKHVRQPERDDGAHMAQWSPAHTAMRYTAYNLILEVLARSATPTVRIRYEDFISHPRAQVQRVLELAAVDEPPAVVDATTVKLDANHNVGGNPMRFKTGEIPLRRDDAWRTELDARQRRVVSGITFPLRLAYRYMGAATKPGSPS